MPYTQRRLDELQTAYDALLAERDRLKEALNKIASWSEGEWSLKLDEPHSAKIARDALALLAGEAEEGEK